MNRNQVKVNKKNIAVLKKQVQKYDRLQTGSMYLGYSRKRHMFILRGKRL